MPGANAHPLSAHMVTAATTCSRGRPILDFVCLVVDIASFQTVQQPAQSNMTDYRITLAGTARVALPRIFCYRATFRTVRASAIAPVVLRRSRSCGNT